MNKVTHWEPFRSLYFNPQENRLELYIQSDGEGNSLMCWDWGHPNSVLPKSLTGEPIGAWKTVEECANLVYIGEL